MHLSCHLLVCATAPHPTPNPLAHTHHHHHHCHNTRLQELVDEGYLTPSDVRVCMGDSGWSPGQLEGEVARGTWAVVE